MFDAVLMFGRVYCYEATPRFGARVAVSLKDLELLYKSHIAPPNQLGSLADIDKKSPAKNLLYR